MPSFWDQGYASFMTIENFFDDAIVGDRNPYYHKTGDILSRVDLDYVTRTTRTALAMIADGAGLLVDGEIPTPTATATPAPTSTPTATPPAGACTELVANGGFEPTDGLVVWSNRHASEVQHGPEVRREPLCAPGYRSGRVIRS